MIITLILALFLLVVVFSRTARKRKANESFVQHNKKFIIIGSVVLLTILVMNVLRPRVYLTDLDEIIENADKDDDEYHALKGRKKSSQLDPLNIPKLFEYVEDCEAYETYDKSSLQDETYSQLPEMQRLALAYVDALASETSFDTLYRTGPNGIYDTNYPDTTQAFHNYIIGQQKRKDGDVFGSMKAFERETKLNPNFAKPYSQLYTAYLLFNREKFKPFIVNPNNAKHLDQSQLIIDYFNIGEYGLYFKTIYTQSFLEMNFFAFIAGLIISIVWMVFLRNMDFFNKERWIDMTLVFLGGAVFTNLCLFLYHSAYYDWGIHLNGEFWNDFFYCVGVIGFSEELVKLIPWILFVALSKQLKEPYDYILYASAAALGFAFTENLTYLEEPVNIVSRSIMSTTMHMFTASLVAYSIVLAKYKYKTRQAKILAPIIGFILACFAHGFYDFWLVSESTSGLGIITTVFFLFTIHFWFYMINNSTNHSSFFNKKLFRINENIEFLSISILGIILLQYIILCIEYGAISANTMLQFGTTFTIGFLLYVTFILSNFKPIRGKWQKYAFPLSGLIKEYITIPFISNFPTESHIGLHLRIFCPRNNKYIGDQFPVSGHCERKITVNGQENWYLFRLNKGLILSGYNSHLIVLKSKSNREALTEEKIELYLMLIPLGLDLNSDDIPIKQLRYTGRTYSKPIL
ncbi:MAG: PrsW family intramembrane metalloprotease [Crocinitomicaceae bacterium]|nr:PrsW family intramembrane metalloprotease [Flavobacteriales bacterium]NQZ34375.1 PrsW family intramembrane metalloprotease [Crocinitomicaceae bacterium]